MIKESTIIKKDTLENWRKAKNFVPKKGEIIMYQEMPTTFKLGDGITKINDLPFISSTSYTINNGMLIIENNEIEKED